ncbi:MAG: response regulator [Proteobacteria bacterium]|nr:response regulator [Pseudomonadota bacterium]
MTADAPHVLVVDDDTRLRELLRRYLSENGFRVTTAADAAEARTHLAGLVFDLIVLDVMMPGESGLALTRSLRRIDSVPILLLTAMGEPADRIAGLERGADDYLAKPFEPRELVLRIDAILRRAEAGRPPTEVRLGEAIFDRARGELRRAGLALRLTSAETALLSVLARSANLVVSREDLRAEARLSGGLRTVDVQVTRLRRKIEPDPREPRYLQTVRGQGYVLRPD